MNHIKWANISISISFHCATFLLSVYTTIQVVSPFNLRTSWKHNRRNLLAATFHWLFGILANQGHGVEGLQCKQMLLISSVSLTRLVHRSTLLLMFVLRVLNIRLR